MLKGYKKSDSLLFVRRLMRDMEKMKIELNEHRYYLERNVERRTQHLVARIALLESCNATLCDKLALVYKVPSALKVQPAQSRPDGVALTNDRAAKLYVLNNQARMPAGMDAQGKWSERATAA